jgi:hypothetical protein
MLFSLFAKAPEPVDTQLPLQSPVLPTIDTSGFRRGIDNVRIDVAFGDSLTRALRQLVDETIAMVMKQHEGKKQWLQPPKPQGHLLVKFQKAYVRTMESAIYQAKNEENEQLIWLARLAIVTHVFDFIDERLERKAHDLKRLTAQGASGRHDEGKQAALQSQSSWLTRHHYRLRDYLLAILLQQISTAEWGKVSKLSHALLNVMQRDFIKTMLDNPVLRANKPDDTWMLVQSYMLPPHADSSNTQESIALINQTLDAMFADIHVAYDGASYHLEKDDLPYDTESFFADVETVGVDLDWRDISDNITQLFAAKGTAEMYGIVRNIRDDEEKKQLQEDNHIRVACQKLLLHAIKQTGMQKAIKASFKANAGYQAVSGALTHRQVYEYFLGGTARRGIRNKIKSMGKVSGDKPETLFKALDQVEDPDESGDTLAFRFLSTFVRYRHDLKIALLMKKHLLRIHVLQSDDDLRLSKANGVLHHFSSDEDTVVTGAEIIGHAIIKADVRGSVGITQRLRDKGLNPATHFSRTFFDPISDLLPAYGAEKVFVEGDAIILSLMEYSTDTQHMAVARACGLSREILRIVESNNEENRRNNLPVLELGIGVVYLTEAPAFLFDGDHKITISPAIGRSDRLSSCSKVVRPVLEKAADHDPLRHTDVFAISEDGVSQNDKGEVHLRYNVNGIDLDPPAFMKLAKEISLKPVDARLFGGKVKERYYVGRFKDNKGYLRFLAVRQGRIRLWDEAQAKRKFLPKQYYFEVIGDQDRLSQLENSLTS